MFFQKFLVVKLMWLVFLVGIIFSGCEDMQRMDFQSPQPKSYIRMNDSDRMVPHRREDLKFRFANARKMYSSEWLDQDLMNSRPDLEIEKLPWLLKIFHPRRAIIPEMPREKLDEHFTNKHSAFISAVDPADSITFPFWTLGHRDF